MTILSNLRNWAGDVEAAATDALSALGPWLAPIPSAALVARATVEHLHWSDVLGAVSGGIIEILGLTATSTALSLWEYNASKRKSDPAAPFGLAAALVGFYYLSTVGLTVLLDIVPNLARFAPAIFPTLALVGTVNLALRSQHKQRLAGIAREKAERKAKRRAKRPEERQLADGEVLSLASGNRLFDASVDILQAGRRAKRAARMEALLAFYADNPDAGPSDAARAIGVSRQTVYDYN